MLRLKKSEREPASEWFGPHRLLCFNMSERNPGLRLNWPEPFSL